MIRYALVLLAIPSLAWAQDASDCSQTVGTGAAAVTFPASGKTGNPAASTYLEICDSHATNTLGINWVGGTAVIGAQGTVTLAAGACKKWNSTDGTLPRTISIIGSAASTTTTCAYR
jgi:hypothetical protein